MEGKKIHLTYGLVTALIMAVLSTILYVSGLSFKPGMQYITYIPFLIGILLNAIAYSKVNDGMVTFGQVFSSCFKACAIVTLVTLVWSFISLAVFPDMVNKAMEVARQNMVEKNLSDEQIDKAIEITRKFFTPFMIAGVIFGTMFVGALFSVIGAAVAKKSRVPVAQ
ncbi:MAG: DUF4199 domain-containing protein [Flavipsychrobacter sp.]|nr:DUF4199 domain-containing protein [Flavipsychrobacter sp.]